MNELIKLGKEKERERDGPRTKAAGIIPPCLAGLDGLPLQSRVLGDASINFLMVSVRENESLSPTPNYFIATHQWRYTPFLFLRTTSILVAPIL